MLLATGIDVLLLACLAGIAGWAFLFVHDGWLYVSLALVFIALGWHLSEPPRVEAPDDVRATTMQDSARVRAALARLSLIADTPTPDVHVTRGSAPLSWTVAYRNRQPTVYVTTELLDRLEDVELEAVLAHELGHLIQRDAAVMTVLAGFPQYVFAGIRKWYTSRLGPILAVFPGLVLLPLAVVLLAVSRIVSRYREFTADRAAALITGSPAAVAAALIAVDNRLLALPRSDLRMVGVSNSLLFVPARRPWLLTRPWGTHPSVEKRLARLARLEDAFQVP
jgi:heat shock protein HtpX